MTGPVLVTVAWGALSFGAVYPWAYWPVMWGASIAGVTGLAAGGRSGARGIAPLALTFGALVGAILLQLAPLPPAVVRMVSPSAHSFALDHLRLPVDVVSGLSEVAPVQAATDPVRLSLRPRSTVTALAIVVALGLLVAGGASALSSREAGRIAAGIVVVGVVVAAAAVAQRPVSRGAIYGFWEPKFPSNGFGPFVNRNHFAGWMVMAFSVGLGYLMALISRRAHDVSPGWRSRILWLSSPQASHVLLVGLALAVMGLTVVLTLSRSGITAFALALLTVGFYGIRRAGSTGRRVASGTSVAVLALVAIGSTGLAAVSTRFAETGGHLDGRLKHWRAAVELMRTFPLAGTGLNTYTAVTPFYPAAGEVPSADEAHNDYLQLAAEGGLLLCTPVAALVVVFARELRRRFRATAPSSASFWLRLGAAAGIGAIAVQELVDFSLQLPGNAALFAVLCAIALHAPDEAGARPMMLSR